jgi:hypothetical protein
LLSTKPLPRLAWWEGKQQDASQETCLFSTEYQTFGKKGLGMGKFHAFLPFLVLKMFLLK